MSRLTSRTTVAVVTVALLLAAVALSLAGLSTVRQALAGSKIDLALLVGLLPFALWSYGLRTLRWHTLARATIPGLSPLLSGYSQVVGFAFSVTPGRVAEFYKLKVLERSTGRSVAQSFPAALIERLTEAVALGFLVVVGGLLHWSTTGGDGSKLPFVAAGLALGGIAVFRVLRPRISTDSLSRVATVALRRVPGGERWIERFSRGGVAAALADLRVGSTNVTRPSTLALALALVVLGRLGDGLVLCKLSLAVGYPVPFPLAMMIVGASGLAGGISFTPGGIGAAEGTFAALMSANGMPLGLAVVTAFATRALLYWIWVVLGLGVFVAGQGYLLARFLPIGSGLGVPRPAVGARATHRREG